MKELLKALRHWITQSEIPTQIEVVEFISPLEDETAAAPLPPLVQQTLLQDIAVLPCPLAYQRALQEALEKALRDWQVRQSGCTNSLMVLTEPVEPTAAIIRAALANGMALGGAREDGVVVDLQADWSQRPETADPLPDQLAQTLEARLPDADEGEGRIKIAVIAALEWCFVRSAEGLAGLEFLQHQMATHPDWFWLIGCNRWTWSYLRRVYPLGFDCSHGVSLPRLRGLDLKQWLQNLGSDAPWQPLMWSPREDDESGENLDEGWSTRQEQAFYRALADKSQGISQVAGRLWVRAQHYQPQDVTEHPDLSMIAEVHWQKPHLPDLPDLSIEDRYLLFSLLLHGGMSAAHLALSLADDLGKVQTQIQHLRQQQLLEGTDQWLQVNPAYYPNLTLDLKRNNFIVDEAELSGG